MGSAKRHVSPNSDRESGLPQTAMSALPPKADMCAATGDVRFGPKADIVAHSIISSARACNAGGTVRPSAFAVVRLNDQFELGRLFDRNIARLSATQNLIDVRSRPPETGRETWSVGYEAASLDDLPLWK